MNPVTPSRVKATIPSTTGALCERLAKLYEFPQLLFEDVAYKFNEDGSITDEFKADICALGCVGSGGNNGGGPPPNPNMPAPTGVNATDGSFADKIQVTWNAVTAPTGIAAVTGYKVYRSLATNTNPTGATLIATVTSPTVTYDDPVDGDLVVGTTYNYWVVATNGVDNSAYSSYDVGSASAPATTMDAISDLRASFGFGYSFIALVWTPPTGATKYDVYRGITNVFADATSIYTNKVPKTTTLITPDSPPFWDNVGEVVFYDTPPSATTDYYYWVVAKKDSPPATSDESNEALGRVNVPAIYNLSAGSLNSITDEVIAPVGATKIRLVGFGSGAGGGGANGTYASGGGGGGAVVVEEFAITAADSITAVYTGPTPDTGNAPTATDGDDGALLEVKINGVTKMSVKPGIGGEFNPAGGGLGGAGSSGSTGTATPTIYEGKPGLPGVGTAGGRSGYLFSQRRNPAGNPFGVFSGDGDSAHPGSGSDAVPINATLAVGGKGGAGRVYYAFGT